MEHGCAKIARGPEHFAGILVAIGVPEPHLISWLTIPVEVVGAQQLRPPLPYYST